MRILAIGDVMGKAGRVALTHFLPKARAEFDPDFVLVNGENAAGGFGLTRKIYDQFTETLGVNCVTMGNHWHDKREIFDFVDEVDQMVLPANMMNCDEHRHGLKILETRRGVRVAVMNLIGKAFMHSENRSPFHALDKLLARIPANVKVRILDMHAEATSEKQGIGRYLVGKASLVYGTHSHVPTADERILDGFTGFTTDLGMTGPYDSVIGIRTDSAVARLISGQKKNFEPATKDLWLCGVVADVDEATGRCLQIKRLRWEMDLDAAAAGFEAKEVVK